MYLLFFNQAVVEFASLDGVVCRGEDGASLNNLNSPFL